MAALFNRSANLVFGLTVTAVFGAVAAVPVGLVLIPLAHRRLAESHGPAGRLDLPGLALASTGLLGVVFGAALDDSETGFVLTAEHGGRALEVAAGEGSRSVDTGECAS